MTTFDPTLGVNGEIRVERLGLAKGSTWVERVRVFMGLTHLGELKIPRSDVDEFIRKIGAVEVRR